MGLKAKTANFIFDSKVFLFDYRAKKMSFCCLLNFIKSCSFWTTACKVRDFESFCFCSCFYRSQKLAFCAIKISKLKKVFR